MKKLKNTIKHDPKVKGLKEFQKLDFGTHPGGLGLQATHFYPNGFGVSVVTGDSFFCISINGAYEIAILKGNKEEWDLTYDTPITSDVLGHQTEPDVNDVMTQVKNLKKE